VIRVRHLQQTRFATASVKRRWRPWRSSGLPARLVAHKVLVVCVASATSSRSRLCCPTVVFVTWGQWGSWRSSHFSSRLVPQQPLVIGVRGRRLRNHLLLLDDGGGSADRGRWWGRFLLHWSRRWCWWSYWRFFFLLDWWRRGRRPDRCCRSWSWHYHRYLYCWGLRWWL